MDFGNQVTSTKDMITALDEQNEANHQELMKEECLLSTAELVDELIKNIQHSNGIGYVAVEDIKVLIDGLTNEIAQRALEYARQLENNIISGD